MAQGRSTKIISMMKWIRTSRLPIKNPLSGIKASLGSTAQGFRAQGSGSGVHVSGFRVQGSGFGVQGSGFRVQGTDSGVSTPEFQTLGIKYRGVSIRGDVVLHND